jgi:2-C-methyl-D-erythritol 4-phosphate cytidylyltransferase
MNTAIIVAAGSGTRFSADTPKQFIPLLGKPLIIHTLEKFEQSPAVDAIVLVLSSEGQEEFASFRAEYNISKLTAVVTGGDTRAQSVRNGLDALDAESARVVAIHDGARPLVAVDEITRTIHKAEESGAACLVAPVTDTIKSSNGLEITGTLDRRSLRRALTPQAFRFEILQKAFDESDLGEYVTDECYLVERLGAEISMVEGGPWNIKITHPADIVVAEALLANKKDDL